MLGWALDFLLNTKRWKKEQDAILRDYVYADNHIFPGYWVIPTPDGEMATQRRLRDER